jgi:hypothetical protein
MSAGFALPVPSHRSAQFGRGPFRAAVREMF